MAAHLRLSAFGVPQDIRRRATQASAACPIRIGTFQFFAARGEETRLRHLSDHAFARHSPEAGSKFAFLVGVIAREAALVAQWLPVDLIRGVMNTDNLPISGETIVYVRESALGFTRLACTSTTTTQTGKPEAASKKMSTPSSIGKAPSAFGLLSRTESTASRLPNPTA